MFRQFIGIFMVLLFVPSLNGTAQQNARQQSSRYESLMSTSTGKDTLLDLALWEYGRVTDGGKLFEYLKSENPLVRLRAVEVIGRIQDRNDVSHLLPMLKDEDQRVVLETIIALGQIGSDEAISPLIELSQNAPPEILVRIAEALGKIGGDAVREMLIEFLHDFHSSVRRSAALGLARLQDPKATRALLIALHDPDAGVVWRAAYALREAPSNRIAKGVLPLLAHEDHRVRMYAARTLGNQRSDPVVPTLIGALNDKDWRVAVNASVALGKIGDSKAVHPLGRLAGKHRMHHVRRAAVSAMEKIGSKKAQEYLIQSLLDRCPGVRAEALKALATILGDKADLFLQEGLEDGERFVRAAALENIGTAGIRKRIDYLIERARKDPDPMMRVAAVKALSHFEPSEIGAILVEMLSDKDWVVAAETVKAIREIEYKKAVKDLIETYKKRSSRVEGNVRLEILKTLKEFKAGEAHFLIREIVEDRDKRIRTIALEILDELGVEMPEVKPDRFFYESAFDPSIKKSLSLPMGTKRAVIECKRGKIEIELFGDDAIQTVANFVALSMEKFYNGLTFHRVVPNFVIQGGCPRGDGWGDAGHYIRSEFNSHTYNRGYVGIAHDGKDTGGSQFFITHSPQHHLDGRYTIFGRVVEGMDVVDRIEQGDTFTIKIID